ncbi:MAG: hypothetical protein H7A25_18505 [Leptospiraceae bacterium]|nr:hypothetical protein [Leptospiraceae bacterium]MCP5501899.1 hypothetical protein [Leptospiraceae bacterium]
MKTFLEIIKNTFTDSEKTFSFYTIFVCSIITIPVIFKEAFTKDVKYIKLNIVNSPIDEIPGYHLTIFSAFAIMLISIYAGKLLKIATELLYLIVPYIEKKLGIESRNSKSSVEPLEFNPNEDLRK